MSGLSSCMICGQQCYDLPTNHPRRMAVGPRWKEHYLEAHGIDVSTPEGTFAFHNLRRIVDEAGVEFLDQIGTEPDGKGV